MHKLCDKGIDVRVNNIIGLMRTATERTAPYNTVAFRLRQVKEAEAQIVHLRMRLEADLAITKASNV